MKFSRRHEVEPEINLIPFIDVLLVVLIFLMLSTTYTKFTEIQLTLPVADTPGQKDYPAEVIVKVSSEGAYWINDNALEGRSIDYLSAQLSAAAEGKKDTVVIISADAMSPHQSVISVMEAAQRAGLARVTFAAKPSKK